MLCMVRPPVFRSICLLFCSLLGAGLLMAQPMVTVQGEWYRTRDGLPHNTITAIHQDRQGYLWVGTYNGLCRYDGFEFRVFHEELHPGGLKVPHAVGVIFEDRSGNIWIGTRGGVVSRFDTKTQTWQSYVAPEPILTSIRCFYQDPEGTIWVGTRDGYLGKVDSAAGNVHFIKVHSNNISGIVLTSNSELLLCGDLMYVYSTISQSAHPYTGQHSNFLKSPNIIERNGSQVLLNGYGVCILSSTFPDQPYINVPWPVTGVVLGTCYDNRRFIIHNEENVHVFALDGSVTDSFTIPGLSVQLRKQELNAVFLDRDNILWFATNSGLFKIDKQKYRFSNLLNESYVRSIYPSTEGIWVGLRRAETKLIPEGNREDPQRTIKFRDVNQDPFAVPTMNCFLKTRNGEFYAGCLEGIARMNKTQTELVTLNPGREKFTRELLLEIWALHEDENGNIWIGTNKSGLLIWDPVRDTLHQIADLPGADTRKKGSFAVWSICPDHDGRVWLGTSNGLYLYNKGPGRPGRHSFKRQEGFGGTPLKGLHVWNIFEDSRHRLWVGTTDDGVNVVEASRTGLYTLNIETGLPSNAVSAVQEDRYGNVWLSTMNGLVRVKSDESIEIYTEENGLVSNDFNFKAAAKDGRGNLYFGTKLGVLFFDPALFENVKSAGYAPVISEFTLLGKEAGETLLKGDVLELEYWENFFQFRFALLHYRNPGRHTYVYRLRGFEEDWNLVSSKNPFARYTDVPPGNYVLEVRASSDGINWHPVGLQKQIRIYPALWQQTWFLVSIGVLIVLLAAVFIRWRFANLLRREKERADFMRRLGELELQALQAQMNPHFIFNSINSIQHYVLSHDEISANNYLTSFARLMRLFLQSSKHKYITLKDELEILGNYIKMEALRFEEKFDHSIEIGNDVPLHVKIPTMILQPFVENSINHGLLAKKGKGNLRLAFRREGNSLCCVIDDNGIGREKATLNRQRMGEHQSMGMGLIEERLKIYEALEEMNVQVSITDKVSKENEALGTLVEICIPITNWKNESSDH